ncbi:MAG: hypothetical protein GX081_08660 [Firmicutes bacterium]|nr:hypothetical protein [Bacillota bacterium]
MVNKSNHAFCFKSLSAVLICFFLALGAGTQLYGQESTPMETSIALLVIKVGDNIYFQDPAFELLDLDTHLLVPVNRLATSLDLDLSYHRSEKKLVLTNNLNQKKAEIFWEEKLYRIDNRLFLSKEPPLFFQGNVFVSLPFLASFLEAEFDWDFRYQALTLNVEEGLLKATPATIRPELSEKAAQKELPPKEGPPFALSSVRYKFGLEHRKEAPNDKSLDGLFKLRLDGYAGEWALSAAGGVRQDFYNGVLTPELSLLRAEYHKDNELIIIGNADLDLEKTFGKKEIWGALYMTPDFQFRRELFAYTDVSGPAEAGDQVLLYLNDLLWETKQLDADGTYLFLDVPLQINRVNRLRVVIQKADGETYETIREVAASPRILSKDRNELTVATGLYRKNGVNEWEGAMVGYRQQIALTENITFGQETSVSAPYINFPEYSYIGADTGIAFRLNKNLIFTLDWLIGGEIGKEVNTGIESSLLYCLEKGFFESVIYYIPEPVTKGVRSQAGQGTKLRSEHELQNNLLFEAEGYLSKSTPESPPWSADGVNLSLTKRYGHYNQNSLAGQVNKKWLTQEVKAGHYKADVTSGAVKHTLRERTVGASTEGEVVNTRYYWDNNGPYRRLNLNVKTDLTLALTNNFLFGLALDTVNTWQEETYRGLRLLGETDAKWSLTDDTLLAGNITLESSNDPQKDPSFHLKKLKTGLLFQHFFNPELNMYAEASRARESFRVEANVYRYTTARLGLNWHTTDRTGKIGGQIGYRSPVGSRVFPQWSYRLSLEKYLPSAFLVELTLERLFDGIWDPNPEDVIRFTVSRALSFADGKIKPYRYTEEDLSARVGGVVYLDINANGRFDEGDKTLAGIKILADGRLAISNEKGEYMFSNLPPGIYRVDFHLPSLPANYTPVTEPQLIRLRAQENFFIDFAVTVNGSVSGLVFHDINADGQLNPGEQPLSWVGVILDEGRQKIFTGADGTFYFEGVSLGAHTITLDPESLPAGLTISGHDLKTVILTEEELDVADLLFPLVKTD